MLTRVRFLPTCQVVLMVGLSLAAGQPMSAQSAGTPSPVPVATQPAKAASDSSPAAQTPPTPVMKFEDVVRMAEKEGRMTSLRSYVAVDFGLKNASYDSPPVIAHAVAANNTHRELYVIDGNGALMFTVKEGDARVTYLANHAGSLQQAGRYNQGRFHSETFQSISMAKAATGFAAEKEFWIRKFSSPDSDVVVAGPAVQKTDSAKASAAKNAKQATSDSDSAAPKKKISWF